MGRRAGQARRRGGEAPPGAVLHALWAAVACRSAFVGTCCEAFARCCALLSPAQPTRTPTVEEKEICLLQLTVKLAALLHTAVSPMTLSGGMAGLTTWNWP